MLAAMQIQKPQRALRSAQRYQSDRLNFFFTSAGSSSLTSAVSAFNINRGKGDGNLYYTSRSPKYSVNFNY